MAFLDVRVFKHVTKGVVLQTYLQSLAMPFVMTTASFWHASIQHRIIAFIQCSGGVNEIISNVRSYWTG